MRLPSLLRTTPFRLTLLFLALFTAGAGALFAYIYISTAGQVIRRAEAEVSRELNALRRAYGRGGADAVNQAVIERALTDPRYVAVLMKPDGTKITGTLEESPIDPEEDDTSATFTIEEIGIDGRPVDHPARGRQVRLPSGELLFVGVDVSDE